MILMMSMAAAAAIAVSVLVEMKMTDECGVCGVPSEATVAKDLAGNCARGDLEVDFGGNDSSLSTWQIFGGRPSTCGRYYYLAGDLPRGKDLAGGLPRGRASYLAGLHAPRDARG